MAKKGSSKSNTSNKTSKSSKSSKSSKNTESFLSKELMSDSSQVSTVSSEYKNKNNTPLMIFFVILFTLIVVVINYMALQWIYKLEEISCKCSEDWKRDYIKYFLMVYFVILFVQMIIFLFNLNQKDNYFFMILMGVFNLFSFINVIISIIYITQLKDIKCVCSEDVRREIYYYYKIITLALFALMLISNILLFFVVYTYASRKG